MNKTIKASFFIVVFLSGIILIAQEPYKTPPKEILDIVTAPQPPRAILSPSGREMLLAESESMPSIAYMSQPLLRIAGTRITPKNNSRQRTSFYSKLLIKNISSGKLIPIDIPEGALIGSIQWSYDSKNLAFSRYIDDRIELWVADSNTGKTKRFKDMRINAAINSGFSWLPGSRALMVYLIPNNRGAPPAKPGIPSGPNTQETSGKVSKVRTYQDLLKDPYDEELFDYYMTAQLAELDIETGKASKLGKPGIYLMADSSPDANFFLIHRIKKPYSYSVPYYSFTHSLEIWNREGGLVHILADLPLADEVPLYGVPTGPRSAQWRPLKSATLIWVEAMDDGNPEKKVPFRDKILTQAAPFEEDPIVIGQTKQRYSGFSWLESGQHAFLTEYDWKKRWRTTYLVNADDPAITPKKIFDLSSQDIYNDPGYPVYKTTSKGEDVILQDKDWVYLSGRGASPEGYRPFLDKFNLKSGKKDRLFHCDDQSYASFVDFVDPQKKRIIIRYETKTDPPNYYIFDLTSKKRKALTDYKDPAPQLTGMKKTLLKYKRADGVPLSGTLYLPADYQEGKRLPLVLWAYPREYSDARLAGQVRSSPNQFTFFRGISQLFFVTQGYAILDGAQMPVLGDSKTMNDTFIEQIVSAAEAAINKLDEMGIIDPKKVGVGGHSYGAFMTANLLAHCDLFAAGIARSGAYNRTLTPFGFQSERRTLWEAPEIYFKVSPFMHAHKINEPLLLIHGEADNNSGTFPIQSQRLFHAIKGHGATARLVMLPNESHGYRAKESVLHVLAEMIQWFDKYVKNK